MGQLNFDRRLPIFRLDIRVLPTRSPANLSRIVLFFVLTPAFRPVVYPRAVLAAFNPDFALDSIVILSGAKNL